MIHNWAIRNALSHSVDGSTALVTRLWISQALGSDITNVIDESVSDTCDIFWKTFFTNYNVGSRSERWNGSVETLKRERRNPRSHYPLLPSPSFSPHPLDQGCALQQPGIRPTISALWYKVISALSFRLSGSARRVAFIHKLGARLLSWVWMIHFTWPSCPLLVGIKEEHVR